MNAIPNKGKELPGAVIKFLVIIRNINLTILNTSVKFFKVMKQYYFLIEQDEKDRRYRWVIMNGREAVAMSTNTYSSEYEVNRAIKEIKGDVNDIQRADIQS